jgi:hypothetical protein
MWCMALPGHPFVSKKQNHQTKTESAQGKLTPQVSNLKKSIDEGGTFSTQLSLCELPARSIIRRNCKNYSFQAESSI